MVRLFRIAALISGLAVGGAGCWSAPEKVREQEIWSGVKLTDLTPPPQDRLPPPVVLATVAIEIHTIDLPAGNVDRLSDVWQMLSPGSIRMNSYNAFSENSFRVKAGRVELWDKVRQLLSEADGQQVATTSLTVPDNDVTDFPVAHLPVGRPIGFVGNNLAKQTANVGPGVLVLRLRAEPMPWARGVRKLIAYPVYTLPAAGPIPELEAGNRLREFYFASAAFALPMGPGDLIVLGPDEYTGERRTLGGLFFNNPEGTVFFNPSGHMPPARKPAARVYVLICTGISG